ncbi:hypothetical protein HK099_007283 [Clydaea vesicula]|uniref:Uncharacterized protein n=1 Tax=Clydaea vesicula TaxID=447962 RepID=A0AAD5XYK1_9FUNG|nr:hypothetical protein HK099_007283 [Clydaea vesicula]
MTHTSIDDRRATKESFEDEETKKLSRSIMADNNTSVTPPSNSNSSTPTQPQNNLPNNVLGMCTCTCGKVQEPFAILGSECIGDSLPACSAKFAPNFCTKARFLPGVEEIPSSSTSTVAATSDTSTIKSVKSSPSTSFPSMVPIIIVAIIVIIVAIVGLFLFRKRSQRSRLNREKVDFEPTPFNKPERPKVTPARPPSFIANINSVGATANSNSAKPFDTPSNPTPQTVQYTVANPTEPEQNYVDNNNYDVHYDVQQPYGNHPYQNYDQQQYYHQDFSQPLHINNQPHYPQHNVNYPQQNNQYYGQQPNGY